MTSMTLPAFTPGRPAAEVDAALRQALDVSDRARECAVLWFAEVRRRELYRDLGYASLHLYATGALGFTENRAWQFKRLADDLERLPVLKEAVTTGQLGWTKAQQVARVATPATQHDWVAKAATTGRRELEQAVRQARQAARAGHLRRRKSGAAVGVQLSMMPAPETALEDPAHQPPVTITLRADGLQLARLEALLEQAHKRGLVPAGAGRIEVLLAGLAALVDGGNAHAHAHAAAHPPRAQVIIQQCPDCGAAAAVTRRGEQPLAPAQVAAACCDAQVRRAGQANRATIAPRVRAAVLARDRYRCTAPGCGETRFLEVHHVVPRAQGGSNRQDNLVTLCGRCHRFVHEHAGGEGGVRRRGNPGRRSACPTGGTSP